MNTHNTDETIFAEAAELPDERRENYLDEVCGADTERRKRIEALLHEHDNPDSVFDRTELHVAASQERAPHVPQSIGDFEIIRELGRGGMGVVYQARQKSLKRKVALKVLSSGLGLSSKAILRFRREAEAAGKLHHTNIVPIYTTGEDRGVHFYAMEFIDGPSLDAVVAGLRSQSRDSKNARDNGDDDLPDWVKETELFAAPRVASSNVVSDTSRSQSEGGSKRSSIASGSGYFDQVATMIAEVADALDHAHEHGVIHRDIKPSNLLLAPDGRLSLNDFGLARMLEQPGMTMTGEFVGSPLYMSPEQITAGRVAIDHRTDIYSLGATLYELLTLRPPFPGHSRDQVLSQILHKDATPASKLNSRIPTDLNTICMKSIEKDPDQRYQSVAQLADDLRRFVNRHAISARRIGPIQKMRKWIVRNPTLTLLLVALSIVVGIAGGLAYQHRAAQRLNQISAIDESKERFMLAIVSGNRNDAVAQIDEAKNLGAEEGWLCLMNGALSLHDGKYEEAVVQLEIADRSLQDNVTAYALLTLSYLWAGDEDKYYQRHVYLKDMEPSDFMGRLAKGWAQIRWFVDDAIIELENARSLRPDSLVGLLLHARALRMKAMEESDPNRSVDLAKKAISEIESVRVLMPKNPRLSAELLHCYVILVDRTEPHNAEILKNTETIDDLAEELELNLELIDAQWALLEYWAWRDDDDEIIRLVEELQKRDATVNNYLAITMMSLYFRRGEWEESKHWFSQTDTAFDRVGTFFRRYVEIFQSESEQERRKIANAFMTEIDRRRRTSAGQYGVFDWTVMRLLDDDRASDVANAYREACEALPFTDDGYAKITDYMLGKLTPEELADYCHKRTTMAEAMYVVAIDCLAKGDRENARLYFQSVVETKYRFLYVYYWSRGFLERLNDPERNELPWL